MIYGGKKRDILKQLFHTFYLLILLTTTAWVVVVSFWPAAAAMQPSSRRKCSLISISLRSRSDLPQHFFVPPHVLLFLNETASELHPGKIERERERENKNKNEEKNVTINPRV